jgi:L-lactate dehydrogenase (cytochrome)
MISQSVSDLRLQARRRLPHFLFEYFDGGSFDEKTLAKNISDLADIQLRQRVLCDVSDIDLTLELFGESWALPIALGPVGLAGMAARRGETQAARAAEAVGVPFCLSTVSACPLKEVASSTTKPFWFQVYMLKDRGFMQDLLQEAGEANCSALVFTVDMPVAGARYRDYRAGLAGAPGLKGSLRRGSQALMRPRWMWDVGLLGRPHSLGNVAPVLSKNPPLSDFFAWISNNFDPGITWDDVDFIRSNWKGPLIVKGILDPEDARAAVAAGIDAVVVSNHGGRQLDGVQSTAKALPSIAAAIGEDIPVFADGGVRSGLDVVRMLSLGADAVLLGRAWAFALAAGGEDAVTKMLRHLEAEMRIAMSLTGAKCLSDLSSQTLITSPSP